MTWFDGLVFELTGCCQTQGVAEYPSRDYLPRKVRVMLDFLRGHLKDNR